jgi:signal transduction histidine kinase
MRALPTRRLLAGTSALAAVGGVALFNGLVVRIGPAAAPPVVVSAVVTVAALAAVAAEWPRSRGWLAPAAGIVAAVSIAVSIAHYAGDRPRDAMWILAEATALLVLLILTLRSAPARHAAPAGGAVAAAQVLMVLRVASPDTLRTAREAAVMWAFGAVVAAALGVYLRVLDARRVRSVAAARRAQRLELARDLHDFVAHDVTGMVVQAQAAQVVARRDPQQALDALRRIEEAGLHALGSLDRTVHMLRELAAPSDPSVALLARRHGIDDLADLVGRFGASDGRSIRLVVDPGLGPDLPAEVADTAYRVVLEALTNVRRHAPGAARVDVSVTRARTPAGLALRVSVRDEADASRATLGRGPVPSDPALGGSGLAVLRERVEGIGGTLSAGARGDGPPGWEVAAVLPIRSGGGAS